MCILSRRFAKIKLSSKTFWEFWVHLNNKTFCEFLDANCGKLEESFEEL